MRARHRNGGSPFSWGWATLIVALSPLALVLILSTLVTYAALATAFFETLQGL